MTKSGTAMLGVAAAVVTGLFMNIVPAQADTQNDQIVAAVDKARAGYGADPVTWNSELYPSTQQYAEACRFEHSNPQGRYGENLYAGTGNVGFQDALDAWMEEASKYDYNHPGFSMETGHFTQVVWKNSRQIAVGIASCPAGTVFSQPSTLIVARFTPPGNVEGRYPENVGRPVD